MVAMTKPVDSRTVETFRIPARSLAVGDLVNTAPGGEDDWQEVTVVVTRTDSGENAEVTALLKEIGDRYVYVEMTDIAPVDSNVYIDDNGAAMVFGTDGDDLPVEDVISDAAARRNYLYTVYELVTIRRQ
jgi:hypothetical protein